MSDIHQCKLCDLITSSLISFFSLQIIPMISMMITGKITCSRFIFFFLSFPYITYLFDARQIFPFSHISDFCCVACQELSSVSIEVLLPD